MSELGFTLKDIVDGVIAKGAGSTIFGGKKKRGPLQTADFLHEVMVNVALELTDRLPLMFEHERQKYLQHQKLFESVGNKGRFTNSYGWDKKRENKIDFSFDPLFFHYFQRIIVPFLGGKKKGWNDENSKIWKYIKKMIIGGDKEKIHKFQRNIKSKILSETSKKVSVHGGTNSKESSASKIIV